MRDQLKKVFIGSNRDDDNFDDRQVSLFNDEKLDVRSKSLTKKVHHKVQFHRHDVFSNDEEEMPDEASESATYLPRINKNK